MTTEQLRQAYEAYLYLIESGEQAEAEQFLAETIEDMTLSERNSLMAQIATIALEDEVRETEEIGEMQEKTMQRYQELEEFKQEVEKESDAHAS